MTRRPRVRAGYMPAESEAAFQTAVIQLARFCGWNVWAPPPNRPGKSGRVPAIIGVTAGWPDLAFWRVTPDMRYRVDLDLVAGDVDVTDIGPTAGEVFWAELKGAKTRVRPDQRVVLSQLRACGLEVHLWRPADWPEIETRLKRRPPWEGERDAALPDL